MNTAKLKLGLGLMALALVAATSHAANTLLDRTALHSLADTYPAAAIAHDASKVPFAADVKIVENVKRIKTGEGLCKSAGSPPTAFKIVAADPVLQELGALVVMQNDGKASQVGIRLRVVNGKIAEAEHLIVAMRDPNSRLCRNHDRQLRCQFRMNMRIRMAG